MDAASSAPMPLIALVGNPNCGKTALFNMLTGSRQKVANYAGVTVERKEGSLLTPSGLRIRILDLPGAYSLDPLTPDEQVTADVLLGRWAGESQPDFVVCVTDATNLRQNLRLVLSLKRLGLPMVVALNMSDIARRKGILIDANRLSLELGVPVVETVGVKTDGVQSLLKVLNATVSPAPAKHAAAWLPLSAADIDHDQAEVRRILGLVGGDRLEGVTLSDRVDAVVLHPLLGPVILAVILFLVFQAVFAWAQLPMDAIKTGVAGFGAWLGACAACKPAQGFVDQRHPGRCRQRSRVSAADHHFVFLHFDSRGLRIPAARRISARPRDGQRGTVGPRLHSAAVELRLCHSRDHGDAHHSKSARSIGDHHDRAVDDLFGAPAGVCVDHRRVHSAADDLGRTGVAGRRVVRAVCGRRRERHGGGVRAEAQRQEHAFPGPDARVAGLSLAESAQSSASVCGSALKYS